MQYDIHSLPVHLPTFYRNYLLDNVKYCQVFNYQNVIIAFLYFFATDIE